MDSLRFQIDELERANLQPGEEEELTARRNLLRNGEKYLGASLGGLLPQRRGRRRRSLEALRAAETSLYSIRTLGDDLMELYKRLENLRCEAYDLAETIRDKRAEFDFSSSGTGRSGEPVGPAVPAEEEIRRHRGGHAELPGKVPGGAGRWIETADDTLSRLEQQLQAAEKKVRAAGAELTQARRAAGAVLEQRIQQELRDLDMNRVRFAIDFCGEGAVSRRL